MESNIYRGRIAPSPTGYLHLGHAKTFWTAYQRCIAANGVLVYRDEDIDFQRCKPEFSKAGMDDLQRLGIHWQEGPFRQSERLPLYRKALQRLILSGKVYPCRHSRKAIQQTPDAGRSPSGEVLFPITLRGQVPKTTETVNFSVNWRFHVPDARTLEFNDKNLGPQLLSSQVDFGDFLVWRKDGSPSYELAVVVDDAAMDITEVVRGEDLLVSTGRQLLLYEVLGLKSPGFYHEHLVKDDSGERLAKRKDSLSLRTLFAQGHRFESIQELWTTHS